MVANARARSPTSSWCRRRPAACRRARARPSPARGCAARSGAARAGWRARCPPASATASATNAAATSERRTTPWTPPSSSSDRRSTSTPRTPPAVNGTAACACLRALVVPEARDEAVLPERPRHLGEALAAVDVGPREQLRGARRTRTPPAPVWRRRFRSSFVSRGDPGHERGRRRETAGRTVPRSRRAR